MRATATTAAGLVAGIGLLALHASPMARTPQAPPAPPPAPAWEIEIDPLDTLQVAAGSAAVYVLEAGGAVRARAVDGDGAVRWTHQAASQPSLLWGAERVLLIEPGLVTALDAATGAIAWTDELPAGDAVATVVDGVLAVGVGTGLFLFNAADGARLSSAGLDVPLQAPPVLAGQHIVVVMQNGALAGIDRVTGRRSWTRPPLATPVDGLAAHDGRAYVSGRDGNLYCVQTHNGEPSWTYSLYARLSGAASASGDLLYVALFDNTVQAFDRRTGTRRWSQPLTGRPASPVWPAGTRLIVAQADGVLAVLDAAAGTQQTRLAPPGEARLLEHAGPVPGTPGAVFTVTTGTSSVRRLGLWRLDP